MSKLLLFDIDGTLLTTDSAGRHALELSFMECLKKDISQINFSLCGKTDLGIINELLKILEIEPDEKLLESIIYYYLEFLPYELEIAKNAKLFDGVLELVDTLYTDSNFDIALLTGNISDGAYKKLGFFGLKKYFNTGGFGDDNIIRSEIFPIAYKRCEKTFNKKFEKNNIIIIGDSTGDIECAKENGLKSLIVGTGLTNKEKLLEMKPTAFINDFMDMYSTISLLDSL